MRGKRSHAEFSPLRVVNFPHVLHVLSMFVVVVLSIFMFALLIVHVTLLRCSSEGHVLEDDAHAHDCEEVGVGGVLAWLEDQVGVVQEGALNEGFQEGELFIVEGWLEEVEDLDGLGAGDRAERVLFYHVKHGTKNLASEDARE